MNYTLSSKIKYSVAEHERPVPRTQHDSNLVAEIFYKYILTG
jgi:hypothetical protein